MTSLVFEYCAIALMISFTAVVATGSLGLVLGIICVILGKDKDN